MSTTMTSTVVPYTELSPELGRPVNWTHVQLQEILDSVIQGIEQARRGEGRILTDSDLKATDGGE